MKKKLVSATILTLILALLMSCSSPESKAINLVKNGILPPISETKIGKGADQLFEKAKYDAFVADDGIMYVNVYGEINEKKLIKRIVSSDIVKENMSKEDAEYAAEGVAELFGNGQEILYQFEVLSDDEFNVYTVTVDDVGTDNFDRMMFLELLVGDVDNIIAYAFN